LTNSKARIKIQTVAIIFYFLIKWFVCVEFNRFQGGDKDFEASMVAPRLIARLNYSRDINIVLFWHNYPEAK
jgi:hypothetical protein